MSKKIVTSYAEKRKIHSENQKLYSNYFLKKLP